MFQILGYKVTAGVNDANVDEAAMVDSNFSRRNNHYIFSENYNLIGACHTAASATALRLNVPTINALGRHHVWPVNRSATIQSDTRIQDLTEYPLPLPINEEIALEESNNLGAATEETFSFLWIAPPQWTRNLPRGLQMLYLRFTATIVINAGAWSADASITFAENLKGGVYSVVDLYAQAASLLAVRMNFPRAPLYNNRKLLPGVLGTQAVGNQSERWFPRGLGEFGRFHSFEAPQIQCCSLAAGGTTIEGRLGVVYLGTDQSLLQGMA